MQQEIRGSTGFILEGGIMSTCILLVKRVHPVFVPHLPSLFLHTKKLLASMNPGVEDSK